MTKKALFRGKGKNPLFDKKNLGIAREVIMQAEEESTQVSLHAMNLFNKCCEKYWEKSIEDGVYPWDKDFKMWGKKGESDEAYNKRMNKVLQMFYVTAEQFRQMGNIDKANRIDRLQDELERSAPSIIKPSASMVRDSFPPGSIPGIN